MRRPAPVRGHSLVASGLLCWVLGALVCVLAFPAWALEPVNVTVEAAIPVEAGDVPSSLRQKAFTRALREAVLEVATRYLPPDRVEAETEALERSLSPEAPRFVLNYRLEGAAETRPSLEDPTREEYVVRVNATVDATRLQEALQELGFLSGTTTRPSLALFLQLRTSSPGSDPASPGFALEPLRQYLAEQLGAEGFVIVEPALYSGSGARPRSAVELARSLGADVGVDVDVNWMALPGSTREAVRGGVAEVRVRSVRARDAVELAAVRLEAPGYSPEPAKAFQSALRGLQPQLVSSVLFQLQQNLGALGEGVSPVRVRLTEVAGLRQVERIQQVLLEVLGAREARLAVLEPKAAELVVDASLSPGSLQERMVSAAYDSFALEPLEVGTSRIELRVRPLAAEDGPPSSEGGGRADPYSSN